MPRRPLIHDRGGHAWIPTGQPLGFFDRALAPPLGVLAALVLFCLMALTCADVIGRYFFGTPVYGAFEMTEMLLAALIFAGLPLVTLRNDHVTVDLLDPVVPDWLFRIQHVVACLIGFVRRAISPGGCGCARSRWTTPARPRRN